MTVMENEPPAQRVNLPEPGRTLLHKTYDILNEYLPPIQGREGYIIGGGTMLAARWEHRNSKDIDVRVRSFGGFGTLTQMDEGAARLIQFDEAMLKAGAKAISRTSSQQRIYTFGDPSNPNSPLVDIVELPANIDETTITTQADGKYFAAASSAEVLAGKWKHRRLETLVRDVYDFAVAAIMDGRALQRAMGTAGSKEALDEMIMTLAERRHECRLKAPSDLSGVPEQFEFIAADPARFAAKGIGKWAISAWRIEREGNGWWLETRCKAEPDGAKIERYQDARAAVQGAVDMGIIEPWTASEYEKKSETHGGCEGIGPEAIMTQATQATIVVNAKGNVTLHDFATPTQVCATLSEGVEASVGRGWTPPEQAQTLHQELQELQHQAIAAERIPSL